MGLLGPSDMTSLESASATSVGILVRTFVESTATISVDAADQTSDTSMDSTQGLN